MHVPAVGGLAVEIVLTRHQRAEASCGAHTFEVTVRSQIGAGAPLRHGRLQTALLLQPAREQRCLPGVEAVAQRVDVFDERPLQARGRQSAQSFERGLELLHSLAGILRRLRRMHERAHRHRAAPSHPWRP